MVVVAGYFLMDFGFRTFMDAFFSCSLHKQVVGSILVATIAIAVKQLFVMRRKRAYACQEVHCEEQQLPGDDPAVDWDRKTRIFVGQTGGGKSTPFTKDGELANNDKTAAFRDSLLLYATRRWVNEDRKPPARTLSLNLIDFGETEVQKGDGKTVVQQRREPVYLPLEENSERVISGDTSEKSSSS